MAAIVDSNFKPEKKPRHVFSAFLIAASLGFLAVLILLRMYVVRKSVGVQIACPDCFNTEVIRSDLILFALVAAILLVAGVLRLAWLGRLVHLLIGLLFLIYLSDLTVLLAFSSRLFLSDVALFIGEGSAIWNQFSGLLGSDWLAFFAMLSVVFVFVALAWLPPVTSKPQRVFLLAVIGLSAGLSLASVKEPYVNSWAVDNVFATNLATTERNRYPEEQAERILSADEPVRQVSLTTPAAAKLQRNVIVVIIESWSAWHSEFFGGYENWSPQLDAAAKSGLSFGNFHSIGFSTTNGLVGILAGLQVWSPFLHWFEAPPFSSAWRVERTLPQAFNAQDYHTAFLTTGPLDLYRKGEWLQDLGFVETEGNEHPFYAGLPRYAFNAASDRALYQRALQWQEDTRVPYLLVLETVTTHQPYVDPDSGTLSLELAMKFADRAFGEFLQALQHSGYFEHGILLAVSDHRSMTPIPARELERFGATADSRVPAFVLGKEFANLGVDNRLHSQADIAPGLELWLSGSTQLRPHQSILLPLPGLEIEPAQTGVDALECAYHVRSDQRGVMDVVCNRGLGQLRLDGASTHFLSGTHLAEADQAEIISRVARLRLEGLRRDERFRTEEAALQP